MKLFRDLFSRHRSNKKKESMKLSSSPVNIMSNNAIHSINQSISPCCDQTLSLFDKHTKCTCHYFTFNENCLAKSMHTKLLQPSINLISSVECLSNAKYILTIDDFCFWYDVRSTLLDVIDRVVAMDETRQRFPTQQSPSTIIKLCLPPSNTIHRRLRRPKTSIAIQTSSDYGQRRNAKVQTNTVTLFPLQKQNLSSARLFFN